MLDIFVTARRIPRAYLTDWAMAWLLIWLGSWIDTLPVFERDFVVDDPLIHHLHTKQRVNGTLLSSLAVYVPLFIMLMFGGLKHSWMSMHHGSLGLFVAVAFQRVIVNSLKNRVGRLRPDFMSRCQWSAPLGACTGDPDKIRDGRRSFPSGHSSLAFAGLTFLSIYLGACIYPSQANSSSRLPNFLKSKPLRLFISLSPLGVATWIAITRLEDYRHHKEDVISGAAIGSICAFVTYNIYWQNPFRDGHEPRVVYVTDTLDPDLGYELAHVDENSNNV